MKLYFLMGIRNLRKRLGYTILNVLGLTLGIAACLTIFLVVRYELSYDAFNRKADRIYKVNLHASDYNQSVSLAIAPALRVDFPELQQVSQVWYQDGSATVKVGNSRYEEKQLSYADGRLPQVFDYTWLSGDARTALVAPGSVVLTESVAKKYFGVKEAPGQTLSVDGTPYTVTGVIRDLPGNTHLPVRFLFSFSTVEPRVQGMMHTFWAIPGGSFVYVVLPPNVSAQQVQGRMHAFIEKNWGKDIAKDASLLLQPLRDIHFDQRYNQTPVFSTTSRQTYWALGGIALFIILIACINFINLSTGLAITRAREVGVRKVLGAGRAQLIAQFMGETAVLVVVSVGLGLLAASLLLPLVNGWLDIRLSTIELYEPRVLGLLGGLTVGVILLAGLYPSFVQSAFQPALSLKGTSGTRRKGLTLRKGLVVLQFAISQLLIIGTIIVARQMDFFQNQDLGFNKDAAISFYLPDTKKNQVMAQAMASNPGVAGYSLNGASPVDNHSYTEFHSAELGLPKGDVTEMKFVDERYIRLFDLRMLAGDTIAPQPGGDTIRRAVVNQTMLEKLHLRPGEAVGKRFFMNGNWNIVIAGVVADFQSESKHMKRRPIALLYDSSRFFEMCVKVKPGGMQGTLASVGKSWSALYPDGLFSYEFLDDHIAALYRQEQKVYTAFRLFSGIAILIGCLGLYGLVAFAAVQRTKEVGVRKVLGASMADIVLLFSREFVVLIGIAFVVATPVAWMVMNKWLDNFAYRVAIGWGTFAMAIAVSFVIAAVTISWESVKAAVVNPVKSLRSE
jgi:putative ABC transport system permease protein